MLRSRMTVTALVTTIFVIALGMYDLVAVLFGGVDASVSRFLQDTAFRAPLVSFTVGFICGHLFGYMRPSSSDSLK